MERAHLIGGRANRRVRFAKTQRPIIERTQRAARTMEPERFAVSPRTRATRIFFWRSRKLPRVVTQVAGAVVEAVHRGDPSDRRRVIHRSALIDARNSECLLAGQVPVGDPGDLSSEE